MAFKKPKVKPIPDEFEEIEEDAFDFDDIVPQNEELPPGRYAKTFELPLHDFAYSKLLDMDKNGKATILSKQYCACPKEGMILVLCEYDINF